MRQNILLNLLAIPTVSSALISGTLLPISADAKDIQPSEALQNSCDVPVAPLQSSSILHGHRRLIASGVSDTNSGWVDESWVDFSAAESDAAATLFGCDCPACIRSLRQLQALSLPQLIARNPSGHCLTALQKRVSPDEVQEVLANLAAAQAKEN